MLLPGTLSLHRLQRLACPEVPQLRYLLPVLSGGRVFVLWAATSYRSRGTDLRRVFIPVTSGQYQRCT
eukprot:2398115-Rhodomonas_salina.2